MSLLVDDCRLCFNTLINGKKQNPKKHCRQKNKDIWRGKLPAGLSDFSGALVGVASLSVSAHLLSLVVCPRCKSSLESNLKMGAVVVTGEAMVGRSWERTDGGVAGGLESFLIAFSMSEVREQSGTMIMGIWSDFFWLTDLIDWLFKSKLIFVVLN